MKIENKRIYINGFLEPLESKYNKTFTLYPFRMIPINEISKSYSVDTNGKENQLINENKRNILVKVDLFDNKKSSSNITDLFSFLYHEYSNNVTTYTHYLTIRNLQYCPDVLGLLDLRESYRPIALQNISTKLYISIYKKQINLFNILSTQKVINDSTARYTLYN